MITTTGRGLGVPSWPFFIVLAAALLGGCSPSSDTATATAPGKYVSESSCASCHDTEHKSWTGSHHHLAMQEANAQSMLGNFDDARFSYAGVTSRFFRRDGKYFVATDGADGKLSEFEIKYAFGVEPLQQYLIELPGGRMQALSIAWDSRQKEMGGQRWFHLYPNERIDHKDELHWTGLAQNWNHMCGECHATDYHKNFDAKTSTFSTTANRYDVGCQSCHGPASRHLEWAQLAEKETAKQSTGSRRHDFDVDLTAKDSQVQIETCARCHSRRGTFSSDYRHGLRLMDTHLPALLDEPLYFTDGQIRDEVYVYGSFLQSRMHAKGMRCSDCHDPHTTKTRATGNALCVSCHNTSTPNARAHIDTSGLKRKNYDSPSHHFHKNGQPGANCVDCHAPARNYMVVDPRHDHSFRIPRPDLSAAIGTPNACNNCHAQRTSQWAADTIARWYGPDRRQEKHYGEVLFAGSHGKPGAVTGLTALAEDPTQPAIVRATALDHLARYPSRGGLFVLQRALLDPDPMVRRSAVLGLEQLPVEQRMPVLQDLLDDPVRGVRIEVARLLAPAAGTLAGDSKAKFDRALAEFESAQQENADRPEAHVNLGNLYLARGDAAAAESAYRKAIAVDARFIPAYVNLADLYRADRRNADADQVLRAGLRTVPKSAPLHEALGLTLVREGKYDEALAQFAAATKYEPDNPRHAYVYAVALHGAGRRAEAILILKRIVDKQGDRDALLALADFSLQAGDHATASAAISSLAAVNPDDPALAAFSGRQ